MELANTSIAMIEEPYFTSEVLQVLKKLAEGTPTEVAVENGGAALVPRILLLMTANYPFDKDGTVVDKEAFKTCMHKYTLNRSAPFLKMAKKPLNLAVTLQPFPNNG